MSKLLDLLDNAVMGGGLVPPGLTEEEADRICALAETKRERGAGGSRKKLLLLSAAFTLSACAVAAASVGGLFQEVLPERSGGRIVPLGRGSAAVEQAGSVVGRYAVSDGYRVTLQGIMGDGKNALLLFDLETENGSPLADRLATKDPNAIRLGKPGEWLDIGLRVEEVGGGSSGNGPKRVDDGSNPARMRFFMRVSFHGENLAGKWAAFYINGLGEQNSQGETLLSDGNWVIEFELDYDDTTLSYPAGFRIDHDGNTVIESVAISPIAVTLHGITSPTDEQMNSTGPPVTLVFRNGDIYSAGIGGIAGSAEEMEDGSVNFEMSYVLSQAVDPAEVTAIIIGKDTFQLCEK